MWLSTREAVKTYIKNRERQAYLSVIIENLKQYYCPGLKKHKLLRKEKLIPFLHFIGSPMASLTRKEKGRNENIVSFRPLILVEAAGVVWPILCVRYRPHTLYAVSKYQHKYQQYFFFLSILSVLKILSTPYENIFINEFDPVNNLSIN